MHEMYIATEIEGMRPKEGWTPHKDLEESRQILKLFIEGKRTFALEYEGTVIGSLGVEEYQEAHYPELAELSGREIGYVLSKAYWGQGLMPEAVEAVMDYLFGTVKLDFLLVGHFDWNRQSARVIEKCRFRYLKTVPYETRYGTVESSLERIVYRYAYSATV